MKILKKIAELIIILVLVFLLILTVILSLDVFVAFIAWLLHGGSLFDHLVRAYDYNIGWFIESVGDNKYSIS